MQPHTLPGLRRRGQQCVRANGHANGYFVCTSLDFIPPRYSAFVHIRFVRQRVLLTHMSTPKDGDAKAKNGIDGDDADSEDLYIARRAVQVPTRITTR